MGKLAEKSGVSAKTISLYEQSPPARPGKKVLSKVSGALGISAEELKAIIYPDKKRAKSKVSELSGDANVLSEIHISRLLRLLDKEIEELRYLMLDCANVAEEHPAMSICIDSVSADIDLLVKIKGQLQG